MSHEYRTYRVDDLSAECLVLYTPSRRWKPPQILLERVTFPCGAEVSTAADYARVLALSKDADFIAPEDWEAVQSACRRRYADGIADTAALLGLAMGGAAR